MSYHFTGKNQKSDGFKSVSIQQRGETSYTTTQNLLKMFFKEFYYEVSKSMESKITLHPTFILDKKN